MLQACHRLRVHRLQPPVRILNEDGLPNCLRRVRTTQGMNHTSEKHRTTGLDQPRGSADLRRCRRGARVAASVLAGWDEVRRTTLLRNIRQIVADLDGQERYLVGFVQVE